MVKSLANRHMPLLVAAALIAAASTQVYVYQQFGGIYGYVEASLFDASKFEGMGVIFALSESFPILTVIAYALLSRRYYGLRRWPQIVLVMTAVLALAMFFGGLRGSRSNTVWIIFWCAGIIHLTIRRIPRLSIGLALGGLVGFMYTYGFFKDGGFDALADLTSSETRDSFTARSGRTISAIVLGDFARADIQAFALYRIVTCPDQFEAAYGRSYVGGLAVLIPKALWPNRPATKTQEITDFEYGRYQYLKLSRQSPHVYGLAGEAMLNFGPLAAPLGYIVIGLLLGWIERFGNNLDHGDIRLLMYPFLSTLPFIILVGDSDNVVFYLAKYGVVPGLVLLLGSRTGRLSPQTPTGELPLYPTWRRQLCG